jgi:hypothetical protein
LEVVLGQQSLHVPSMLRPEVWIHMLTHPSNSGKLYILISGPGNVCESSREVYAPE